MAFESASDFEKVIALLMSKAGWQIKMPPANTRGYDIEATRGNEVVAVQVKNYRTSVKVPQLEKFIAFMETPEARRFTHGIFVTASNYSRQALTYFDQVNPGKIKLATYSDQDGKFTWIGLNEQNDPPPEPKRTEYFGVFTCKGGVGKTTVSAHLAGALALSGYDVALIDLDPQKNLSTLLGQGVYLPRNNRKLGNAITIYNIDDWDESVLVEDNIKMVVCDCSPVLRENPRELLSKFSYCIIPTTLNPLGLNQNGHVIASTLKAIREVNQTAHLFVLINNHMPDETLRSQVMKEAYKAYFAELASQDDRFHFIDPDEACIRNSKQLFYWGYHLYVGGKPQLAFQSIGGRCYPKADFLNLLTYLEEHTDIERLKGEKVAQSA